MKLRSGATTIALVCLSTSGCFSTLASIVCDDGSPRCDDAQVEAFGADVDLVRATLSEGEAPPLRGIEIQGRLHAAGQPVRRASVEVVSRGVVEAWTTTDADGRFAISAFVPRNDCSIDVRVDAASYTPSSLPELPCGGIELSYDFLSGEWRTDKLSSSPGLPR